MNGQNYVALLKPRPAVSFISSWLGKTLFFLFDPQIEDIPKDLVNEHYGIREKIDDLWFDFLIIAHRIGLGRTPFLAVPISILAYVYGVTGSFELAIVTLGLLSFFLNMIVGGFVSIVIPFIIVTPSIIEMRYNLSRAKTPGRVKKWEDERQLIRLRLGSLLQGENLLWLFIREAVINLFSIVYVSGVLVSIWFFYDPTVYSRQIIASQALTIIPVNVLSKALLVPRGLILGIDWGGNNIVILPLFLGLIMSMSRVINILVLSQTSKDMMDLASLIITYDPSSESKISLNQEFIIQGIVIPQFRLALAIGFIAPAAFQLFLLTLLLLPMFPNIRRLLADDTKQ